MPTPVSNTPTVLTINGGSSSIKFAVFEKSDDGDPSRRWSGQVERVGTPDARLTVKHAGSSDQNIPIPGGDLPAAVRALIDWLQQQPGIMPSLSAIAHRVVHGGPTLFDPQPVTPAVLAELRRVSAIDPDHLPGELQLIDAFAEQCPGVPQIVAFDTAFHRDLPAVARVLPLPRKYEAAGVRRYGFHGLSYQYLMGALRHLAGDDAADGRVILAHLGSGASLAAVHGGKPIDTTMSFTPAAGLIMGTRTGDLDPGVMVYLLRTEHASADDLDRLINHESGLKGISGTSADVRDLLARRSGDPQADLALRMFCLSAAKQIGAMTVALGGLDTLVFSGGIGENAAEIRAEICALLGCLGVELDPAANAKNADVLSTPKNQVTVRRIPTDEELVLARIACKG